MLAKHRNKAITPAMITTLAKSTLELGLQVATLDLMIVAITTNA
jgi:hypothetical protein